MTDPDNLLKNSRKPTRDSPLATQRTRRIPYRCPPRALRCPGKIQNAEDAEDCVSTSSASSAIPWPNSKTPAARANSYR